MNNFEELVIKSETDWTARLQLPTRILGFDNQPDLKEYILSEKEILTLNEQLVKDVRQQLLKAVEEMKEELPTILWKDEHEPNLIKRAKNHALDQVLDLLKAKDYIQEFDNQIPREGL